jgi:hypothetical protein
VERMYLSASRTLQVPGGTFRPRGKGRVKRGLL